MKPTIDGAREGPHLDVSVVRMAQGAAAARAVDLRKAESQAGAGDEGLETTRAASPVASHTAGAAEGKVPDAGGAS